YRHTLVLIILLVFYAPIGLQKSAIWLRHVFFRNANSISAAEKSEKSWFLILVFTGLSICAPKLFRPIRMEKQGYRATAMWLRANTNGTDIIAVPDIRMTFYAEREGVVYENENSPSNALYIVRILKNLKDETVTAGMPDKVVYEYADERGKNIVICRK
ncbi:MAG: hypothetical protein WCE45_02175, partial [Sedimentisphaerales bacterium]